MTCSGEKSKLRNIEKTSEGTDSRNELMRFPHPVCVCDGSNMASTAHAACMAVQQQERYSECKDDSVCVAQHTHNYYSNTLVLLV